MNIGVRIYQPSRKPEYVLLDSMRHARLARHDLYEEVRTTMGAGGLLSYLVVLPKD